LRDLHSFPTRRSSDLYTRLIPFWLVLLMLTFRPCAFGQESSPTPKDAAKPNRFLRFANRAHVELKGTRGLLNLNGSFTVEAWLRDRKSTRLNSSHLVI